jgi:hypothetical protein
MGETGRWRLPGEVTVAVIPIRLPPLPGEALDSWLEAYAQLLHVTVGGIFALAGLNWDPAARENGHKPWLYYLDEQARAALSAVCGVPAATLADMTLARYQGTGLATADAPPGVPRTPRWWRQPIGSRYCPHCLAANGGRWMLTWRIPWTFACRAHRVLLADTCPGCGRRHRITRTGQPRQPGCCDLTGLPLPPPRPRPGTAPCTSDPADTAVIALPAGGHVLRAQQHIDARIAALLAARGQPPELATLQQYLDDAHVIARAAVAALHGPASPPAAVSTILTELGARPGAGIEALAPAGHGQRRLHAPVIAFGTAVADVMLHGRHGDPDPAIAAWLADTATSRSNRTSPADMLARWGSASPALQAALVTPLGPRMDTFRQLRYGIPAGPARVPDPALAQARAAALPSLLWQGWALRLMPPGGSDILRYRFVLGTMLAIASAGAADYRAAQELLGLQPVHCSTFGIFTARLRDHGVLEPVTAAICQLARSLGEHGAPIDYARRRLPDLSQAQLDVTGWRRSQYFLPHPGTPAHQRHTGHADLPADPAQERLARLRLIETLTGTHPCYLPGPLRLPERHRPDYAGFVSALPEPMSRYLHQRARFLLCRAGIDEPVSWEPPFDWVTGITWPGPHPDAPPGSEIPSTEQMNDHAHPLASRGGPETFLSAVRNAFSRPHAEQRIRRILAVPGHPSLPDAARHLGIKHTTLLFQVRQLEAVTGITLLRTGQDGMIALTADGEQLARDLHPLLESLAQSGRNESGNHASLPLASARTFTWRKADGRWLATAAITRMRC